MRVHLGKDRLGQAVPLQEVAEVQDRGLVRDPVIAQAVVGAGLGLVELRPTRMSLEEIFLQLTTTDTPSEEVARA